MPPDKALDALDLRGAGYHVKFARNLPAVKVLRHTFGSDVGHEYWVSRVSQVRAEPAESAGLTEWQMRGVILALDRNEALTGTRRSS
jgi:hypothetical protein